MKILFAIKHLSTAVGGAERVLCTIASALVARGHDVSVLTFDQHSERPFYSIDERVQLINLGIGNASASAGVIETLKRLRALRSVIKTERPDIAIGFMHSMFIPLAIALFGTRVPCVGSEHIVPQHYRQRRFQFFLLLISARLLKRVTVLSETIKTTYPRTLQSIMVPISNPIETSDFIEQTAIDKKHSILLNVGRLDDQKDQATLIKAFSKIAHEYPNWQLKIIGEGPLRSELETLIDALGLKSRICLPGVTTKIQHEYAAADIFVISSVYEAFGLVTAEAMSHGLPCIGFADCPGTNELISHNVSGILVHQGSSRVDALADCLAALMTDLKLQKKLGNAGRDQIRQHLSTERICDQWEGMMQEITTNGV